MAEKRIIHRTQARVAAGGATLLTLLAVVACLPLADASRGARCEARLARVMVAPLGASVCIVVVRDGVCERPASFAAGAKRTPQAGPVGEQVSLAPGAGVALWRLNIPPPSIA